MSDVVVVIGNPKGRIALYLDDTQAMEIAEAFGRNDRFYDEIWHAINEAYPEAKP